MRERREQKNSGEFVGELIEAAAEFAGGAAGSTLGLLAAGPAGAALLGAAGAGVAMLARKIGAEMKSRALGPREEVRVGGVLALAIAEIREKLENGENIRSDGFFDEQTSGRSDAEEVFESVLLKSQREPEEKKLPYMAHLFASIAFDSSVGPALAHQLLKIAEALSYRQLCIMKLAAHKEHFHLRDANYRGVGRFDRELLEVLYECYDLYSRGLITFGGSAALGVGDVHPAATNVQGLGGVLYSLMQLRDIPEGDWIPIVRLLQ